MNWTPLTLVLQTNSSNLYTPVHMFFMFLSIELFILHLNEKCLLKKIIQNIKGKYKFSFG